MDIETEKFIFFLQTLNFKKEKKILKLNSTDEKTLRDERDESIE